MASLSGAWLVLCLLQLIAWAGASVLGAGVGKVGARLRTAAVGGLALVATGAALAALVTAAVLAGADMTWGAEKLLVVAPIGVLSSLLALGVVAGNVISVRRAGAPSRLLLGVLISAVIGALSGPIAILLIGSEVTWPAALATALVWLAGSGVAVLVSTGAPRRAVISAASSSALATGLLLLFTVFGPTASGSFDGHHLSAAQPGTEPAVSVAEIRETDPGSGLQRFALEAQKQTVTLPGGREYDAITFGSLPGPQLVVTQNELIEVTLTNRDVEGGVTLHWHGYDVPSGDDGVAGVTQDAVLPGESFVYRFVADQPGTYWYHTHQDALDGIAHGLYGALIVLPDSASAPSTATDVPALIHTIGGVTLVGEGQVLAVPGDAPVRLRLANTDQSPRRVVLDAAASLVALDGTDLAEPAAVPAGMVLRIPAGGRADLLLDAGAHASLRIERGGDSGIAVGGGDLAELSFRGPEFDVLDAASGSLPAWANGPVDVEAKQVLDRLLRVVDGVPRMADTINGAAFPVIQPIVVDEGDVVVVTIVNRGTETHPMHLHGHHMVVLSRDGVATHGALWLDTVDVRPGETWRVAFIADNPGVWMDHCHNLEHAAAGMVMHLAYRGVTSPFELGGSHGNSPE
jgi:FtsP/CotA-like multicopper oxidase with cupredoxin domain